MKTRNISHVNTIKAPVCGLFYENNIALTPIELAKKRLFDMFN